MKEPKRLAHRQAERNKARALKHWDWDEDDASEPQLARGGAQPESELADLFRSAAAGSYPSTPLLSSAR